MCRADVTGRVPRDETSRASQVHGALPSPTQHLFLLPPSPASIPSTSSHTFSLSHSLICRLVRVAMSRLKRKLENAFDGNLPANLKLNESFCMIGTPLPPLEKSKDTGEFVPVWKQDVRDEKGRRRLHGAFTGGFSAGYFNTVGSKEGACVRQHLGSTN